MRLPCRCVVALTASLCLPRITSAQTSAQPTVDYGQFWNTLYAPVNQAIRLNGGPASLELTTYGSAVLLSGLLVAQTISLPTGNNAGGFSWTYDPALGIWSKGLNSFGPHTAERAETIGRRKLNVGFAYQRFAFDQLDGGPISVESQGTISGGAPLTLRERVALSRADVSLATTFINYGILPRLDVGLYLPVISVAVDGALDYTLRGASSVVLSQGAKAVSARSQRLGDPVFTGKINVIRQPHIALAASLDARIFSSVQPGAGGARAQAIASTSTSIVNAHVNAGLSGYGCNSRPFNVCSTVLGYSIAGGIDKAVTNKLTLAADIQRLRVDNEAVHTMENKGESTQTVPPHAIREDLRLNDVIVNAVTLVERAYTSTLSMTAKFNAWGNMLLTFTALVPMNSSGLTARFTPILGVDYAW